MKPTITIEQTTQINALLESKQNQIAFQIGWLQSLEELDTTIGLSLVKLYQEAFAEAPYFEKFEDDEARHIIAQIITAGGLLLFAERPLALGQAIAFVASEPLKEKPDVIEFVGSKITNPDRMSYFAEDAVSREFRRQGISAVMKSILLEMNRIMGYEAMLLRTSAEPENAQLPAVLKAGFKPIDGLLQEVMSKRADGSITPDRRCFFQYDLRR